MRKDNRRELQALRIDTSADVTNHIRRWTRKKAIDENCGLRVKHTKTGGIQYRQVPMVEIDREARILGGGSAPKAVAAAVVAPTVAPTPTQSNSDWTPLSDDEIREFITRALEFKPDNLVISEIKWKYLIRSALRGKNILMIGPSGCGKTLAAQSVHTVFNDRPWFYFNFGASQDSRGMLIGNTHYDNSTGTLFAESLFAKAIQIPPFDFGQSGYFRNQMEVSDSFCSPWEEHSYDWPEWLRKDSRGAVCSHRIQ